MSGNLSIKKSSLESSADDSFSTRLEKAAKKIYNDSLDEILTPSDLRMKVPGDGKCGWWSLALAFNIQLVCGNIDHYFEPIDGDNDPISETKKHYQTLLMCLNLWLEKEDQNKIDNVSDLKNLLLNDHNRECTEHASGQEVFIHQETMLATLYMFYQYTNEGFSYEQNRILLEGDSSLEDLPLHDNGINDLLEITHRYIGSPTVNTNGWLKAETGEFILGKLGLNFAIIRHLIDTTQLYEKAAIEVHHKSNNPNLQANFYQKQLLALREDQKDYCDNLDGRDYHKGKPNAKLLLHVESPSRSLGGSLGQHFEPLVSENQYSEAIQKGLKLPKGEQYDKVNAGTISKCYAISAPQKDLKTKTLYQNIKSLFTLKSLYNLATDLLILGPCAFTAIVYAFKLPPIAFGIITACTLILWSSRLIEYIEADEPLSISSNRPHLIPKPSFTLMTNKFKQAKVETKHTNDEVIEQSAKSRSIITASN